jgi:hypothetical protein
MNSRGEAEVLARPPPFRPPIGFPSTGKRWVPALPLPLGRPRILFSPRRMGRLGPASRPRMALPPSGRSPTPAGPLSRPSHYMLWLFGGLSTTSL